VERSQLVFDVMKLAGAGYLVYLGIRAWRERRLTTLLEKGAHGRRSWPAVRDGFVVGVANPKAAVFRNSLREIRAT
jgi:threonine/homoserine/homoserine lactone efflux protein